MLFKTEVSVLDLTIDTEKSLDNCIALLRTSDSLTSCSLHFTVDNLPSEKIIDLTDLIKKQIKLDTLALTADVSMDSCEKYTSILEKVFAELNHLRVLAFRGLFSDCTTTALIELLQNTKTLSELSVGACYAGQCCYVLSEHASTRFAKALEQNTTLTHLDLRRNVLKKTGVATIINSLSSNTPLKVLKLSKNLRSGKYAESYSGEGVLELLGRHDSLEEIDTDGLNITPLKFEYSFASNEELASACTYLSRVLTLRHLDLGIFGFKVTTENLKLLALTINNLPLKKLELYGLTSKEFQVLCEESLIKPGTLTEVVLMGISHLDDKSADCLIQLIQHNTHLTSLSFCPKNHENFNWIDSRQALELGEALGQNRNLIHFKLARSKLDNPKIIAGIIANNSCLEVLDLENNGFCFSADEVDYILDALSENKTLLTLDLCSNYLIFPKNMNKKIHLIDFQILNYPGALDKPDDWGYYNDFHLENIISLANYRMISEMVDKNKQRPIIQKYLLLGQLVTQEPFLNTDLFNFIFLKLIFCTFKSNELESMGKNIRKSKEETILEIAPPPKLAIDPASTIINNPPESNSFPFLLELGASLAASGGVIIGTVALLSLFGVINLSGAGIALLLTTGCVGVGLGIYGFYKVNSKQGNDSVILDEDSLILNI